MELIRQAGLWRVGFNEQTEVGEAFPVGALVRIRHGSFELGRLDPKSA